jgi:hypothetical protein
VSGPRAEKTEAELLNQSPPSLFRAGQDLPTWLEAADSASTTEPPTTVEAPRAAAEPKPLDALTLIELARTRRSQRDILGALELYERAMHRRPNHLDEIIADLSALVKQPEAPGSAHRLLGEALAMAGRFKESLEQYRLAMGK